MPRSGTQKLQVRDALARRIAIRPFPCKSASSKDHQGVQSLDTFGENFHFPAWKLPGRDGSFERQNAKQTARGSGTNSACFGFRNTYTVWPSVPTRRAADRAQQARGTSRTFALLPSGYLPYLTLLALFPSSLCPFTRRSVFP